MQLALEEEWRKLEERVGRRLLEDVCGEVEEGRQQRREGELLEGEEGRKGDFWKARGDRWRIEEGGRRRKGPCRIGMSPLLDRQSARQRTQSPPQLALLLVERLLGFRSAAQGPHPLSPTNPSRLNPHDLLLTPPQFLLQFRLLLLRRDCHRCFDQRWRRYGRENGRRRSGFAAKEALALCREEDLGAVVGNGGVLSFANGACQKHGESARIIKCRRGLDVIFHRLPSKGGKGNKEGRS